MKSNTFLFLSVLILIALTSCNSSVEVDGSKVNPSKSASQKKLLNFYTISENVFQNESGATNYYLTIAVENFDYNNEVCWDEIIRNANTKPHQRQGLTAVFFFDRKENTPKIYGTSLEWESKYDKYCVAGYWHFPTNLKKFTRYPMR